MSLLRFAEPHIYTPVDDSLVLCISGRGRGVGSKVFDLSKKGNHGTIYGATWKNTPLGHSVLSFDGVDDYVDCGNDESLQVGSCFTYEMWLKVQACPNQWPIWLGNEPHTYFAIRQHKGTSSNKITFEWGLPPYDGSTFTDITLIPTDKMSYKWFHVVATYDGDTVKGYRNGEFVDSKSGQTLNTAPFTVYINQYGRGIGLVGEVRIYNRALSAGEVMERYQKTKHLYGY